MSDLGLLVIRLVFGLVFAAHGAQKLFGWFGGYGIAGTAGFFESIGLKPGKFHAAFAGVSEVAAGLLMALGLLMPVAGFLMVAAMLVAIAKVHGKNGLLAQGGYEYNLAIIAVAVGLALTGPGAYTILTLLG